MTHKTTSVVVVPVVVTGLYEQAVTSSRAVQQSRRSHQKIQQVCFNK